MECLWYNGNGQYELLEFDPRGLTKEQMIERSVSGFSVLGAVHPHQQLHPQFQGCEGHVNQ